MKRRWIGLAIVGLGLAVYLAGYLLWWTLLGRSPEGPAWVGATILLLGGLIVSRQPKNVIGLIYLAVGLAGAVSLFSEFVWQYSGVGVADPPLGARWWLWVTAIFGVLVWFGLLLFVPLLFPNGKPPRGFRWVLYLGVAVVGIQMVIVGFHDGLCAQFPDAGEGCLRYVDNPVGIPGIPSLYDGLGGNIMGPFVMAAMVGALLSVVVRWRRSRGLEGQQLKWFASSVLVSLGIVVPAVIVDAFSAFSVPQWIFFIPLLGPPVAVAIAILRYRLYEIDRIINRTVVYAIVVGLLVAVYVAGVVFLQLVLPERGDLAVAASTLAAAALFNPLRERVQSFVDRRFYRSRYDAKLVVEEFSTRLREEVDLEELAADWVGVVQETVRPSSVSVWVREP